MKLTLMKFFVGGFAVLLSYIVSVTLPWKEFGGIFATFPAVFLVSMFITGMQYGDKVAVHVSRGAVFGMTGVLVCILVTWMMLHMTHMWLISIIVGFLSWFISAVCIFEAVEFIVQKRLEKHSWKAGKSNSK
ncbi:TPA: DUF3147 family protein [Staphylococcus aureus]|nr:DUF3147 family protein [Staphylococcus aureus]HEG7355692.1 DUF3147 family protein [Staphylococcus aureus]